MRKLYLDTTVAKQAKVEISDGHKTIEVSEPNPLLAIEKALKKTNLQLKDIDNFSANNGPGSYTGIRVGLAVVNCLNWVFGKEVKQQQPKYQ